MKKIVCILLVSFGFVSNCLVAQETSSLDRVNALKSNLTKWDPIRGEWLAISLLAVANNQPVPDRNFPESITPFDLYRALPDNERESLNQTIGSNARNSVDQEDHQQWDRMNSIISRTGCQSSTARSFGDPHLQSFDGSACSFQTVGEFILTKSVSNRFEVQTRQQAQRDDFSLNTAVAMNVGGDRVCIYANEKPDRIESSALRVNGQVVILAGGTYFLAHGGTINYSNNSYRIAWPSGEIVQAEMRYGSPISFINLTVQIFPCSQNDMDGLLGNANGNRNDDFETNSKNRSVYSYLSSGNELVQLAESQFEKEFLTFLAIDFARKYRITQETSLFDYGNGMNTLSYTDESFPRTHLTLSDLTPSQQSNARRICEENGVRGEELKGCIYDQAYLQIPPSPRPFISDPVKGLVFGNIERPIPNVNPGRPNYSPVGDKTDSSEKPVAPTVHKSSAFQEIYNMDIKPSSDIEINKTEHNESTPEIYLQNPKPPVHSKTELPLKQNSVPHTSKPVNSGEVIKSVKEK